MKIFKHLIMSPVKLSGMFRFFIFILQNILLLRAVRPRDKGRGVDDRSETHGRSLPHLPKGKTHSNFALCSLLL